MKTLRTASLESNFTVSYKKKSIVKKRRCDNTEWDEDSSACVTAVASIANNEKERKERAKDKCRDIGKL